MIEFYFTHKLQFNLKRLLTEHQLKRRSLGSSSSNNLRRSQLALSSSGNSVPQPTSGKSSIAADMKRKRAAV